MEVDGKVFPASQMEFDAFFPDEQACRDYLAELRWLGPFRCPRCGHRQTWPCRGGRRRCRRCDHQGSVTAGTIFHGTRHSLRLWFRAAWLITMLRSGVSAEGLRRFLGLRSYVTAWTWLHKLRHAMRDEEVFCKLTPDVEASTTATGIMYRRPDGSRGPALIAVATELRQKGPRLRMRHVPDTSAESLHGFIADCVEPGSIVRTTGWPGFSGLHRKGFRHEVRRTAGRRGAIASLLPQHTHVCSLVRKWLASTYHQAVSVKYLDDYLGEFAFRFNRRGSHPGLAFRKLLWLVANKPPATYADLVDRPDRRGTADPAADDPTGPD